jgi:predicted Fe-S protein YdhL (DUF1289 family)
LSSINTIQTPCIGVCSTGIGDAVCRGCKRFSHEIIDWNRYAPEQRKAVMARLEDLLNQVVGSKIEVNDREKLLMHLNYQQINHDKTQSPQALAYALLRVGAKQIKNTHHFGFSIRPQWQNQSLASLKQQIDEDFYILSCAYYERFIEPTRLMTIE